MPLPTATFTIGTQPPINFRLMLQGADFAREAVVTEDHIPGGDVNVVSIAGKMLPTWDGQAWFANYADYTAMRDNVGAQGLLVTGEDVVIYSAVLKKVGRQRVMGGDGGMFCTISFLNLIL